MKLIFSSEADKFLVNPKVKLDDDEMEHTMGSDGIPMVKLSKEVHKKFSCPWKTYTSHMVKFLGKNIAFSFLQ